MKTVIYHSADYDGIFCREIAKKFLGTGGVQYTGWNFGDAPLPFPQPGENYVIMDLPVDQPFGCKFKDGWLTRNGEQLQPIDRIDWGGWTWIDHHKSSIESHPNDIPGYRVDGVAACRLAWQWFNGPKINGAVTALFKEDWVDRKVDEPLAVRLAGEYDVWDKRDPRVDTFQYALRASNQFNESLQSLLEPNTEELIAEMLKGGEAAQHYAQRTDADICKHRTWITEWEGLKWLTLNTARCNSLSFAARDIPETGHDALLAFYYNGARWVVSMYHAAHRKDLDLSRIAVKYAGGGHRGACGFQCDNLPFL